MAHTRGDAGNENGIEPIGTLLDRGERMITAPRSQSQMTEPLTNPHPQSVAELLESRQILRDQMSHFSNVMLVTSGKEDSGLRARPMAVAHFDAESPMLTVWFITHIDSTKVAEVRSNQAAHVLGQSSNRFISVSGSVDVVRDQEKIAKLWQTSFEVWFPDGPTDPDIALLAFYPEAAEVWDSSGLKGIRYMFEAAKALITGEAIAEPSPSQKGHRTVDLSD
jgi:general stress protein 26